MKALKPVIIVAVVLAFTFFFPRFLLARWDPGDPWLNYCYQYGFGLVTFLIGLFVILKTGACQLGRGRDSFWFGVLCSGYVAYATVHALWIVAAQSAPYLGGN